MAYPLVMLSPQPVSPGGQRAVLGAMFSALSTTKVPSNPFTTWQKMVPMGHRELWRVSRAAWKVVLEKNEATPVFLSLPAHPAPHRQLSTGGELIASEWNHSLEPVPRAQH